MFDHVEIEVSQVRIQIFNVWPTVIIFANVDKLGYHRLVFRKFLNFLNVLTENCFQDPSDLVAEIDNLHRFQIHLWRVLDVVQGRIHGWDDSDWHIVFTEFPWLDRHSDEEVGCLSKEAKDILLLSFQIDFELFLTLREHGLNLHDIGLLKVK